MFEPGTVIGGKYRVDGTIATGGMGLVLRATHLHLREPVAIKILRPDTEARPESVARFMREARTTMKLRGEHVVRVFDVDLIDRRLPYIVMELLDGEDLALRIARDPIAPDVAVDWLVQLCEGVAEAHASGIVHRDLKPANVFLTRAGVIKVLDFGVSKASAALFDETAVTASSSEPRIPIASSERREADDDVDLTSTRTTLGSPRYMSPEQMRCARDVDERSDIWAIGAIAHEMLSGDPPFEGADLASLRDAITRDTPKPLAAPAALRAIVERCLAKDPNERFTNVRQLARALQGRGAKKNVFGRVAIGGAVVLVALALVISWPRAREAPRRSDPSPPPQLTTNVEARADTPATTPMTSATSVTTSASAEKSIAPPVARTARSAKVADDHLFDNPE